MCFSAEASFTGAVVLTIMGCLTLSKISKSNQILLASIPFLFAFQQLTEGFLWLTTKESLADYVEYAPTLRNIFLFMAILVWPVWIPLSFFVAEEKPWARYWLFALLLLGIAYVSYCVYGVLYWWSLDSVSVEFFQHSIKYSLPLLAIYIPVIVYCVSTLLPPFFSSLKGSSILGIANLLGFVVAQYFYTVTYISVWCFFAAWVSMGIYGVISYNRQKAS